MVVNALLALVIELTGVTGTELRARAFFDANNVKVGDPLVLTVDFLGEAEFRDLHPPALAKAVNRRDWKIDDSSAKTSTYRDARRLTYRVRPMREGLLWFPELEFRYDGKLVKANAIPVHARAGAQVVVDEMQEAGDDGYPKPPAILEDETMLPAGLGNDVRFRWRKALAHPSADAFAGFDFPAAKMNEATCAINDGNWARALKIYHRLEWFTGQTPEIEKGIVAALAKRYENPGAELPVWRTVLRPLLRYPWQGRAGIVAGSLVLIALVFWLLGRGIRAVAAFAPVLLFASTVLVSGSAFALDIFEQMEQQMNRMRQQMNQTMRQGGGFGFHFGEKEVREVPKVTAAFAMEPASVKVGQPFEFILALEAPKTSTLGQLSIRPSEAFGLAFTGQAQNLPDGKSANPTNTIKRIAIPARYDVPFRGDLSFVVEGMITGRQQTGRGGFFSSFTFSNSFQAETPRLAVEVKPLPSAGQPAGFSGIISEGLRLHELCDILKVGTNDVVTITYKLYPKGFVPKNYLLPGAAYEWTRQNDREGRPNLIEYRRYFVADGTAETPKVVLHYYDPRSRGYKRVETGGTKLVYTPE